MRRIYRILCFKLLCHLIYKTVLTKYFHLYAIDDGESNTFFIKVLLDDNIYDEFNPEIIEIVEHFSFKVPIKLGYSEYVKYLITFQSDICSYLEESIKDQGGD